MRTLLASVVLAPLLLTAGCLGCSAFSGGGDKVYQRDQTEQLTLCENGGFVATLSTGTIEGKIINGQAIEGDNGQVYFALQNNTDGTVTTPELGGDSWQPEQLNQTALDHADVACQTLEQRAWWNTLQ